MAANNGAHNPPTLIVTRPMAQGKAFAEEVAGQWDGALRSILSPLIAITQQDVTPPPADALILTSANGVTSAAAMKWPTGMQAWCVGAKTAAVAREAGFDAIEGPGDAAGLVAMLTSERPTGTLLHMRGQHSRGDIAGQLTAAGLACAELISYDQTAQPLTPAAQQALQNTAPVILPLFSPRTATILSSAAPFAAPLHVVALSDAVKSALRLQGLASLHVVDRPDGPSMVAATLAVLREITT
ncbi:MAG: uroporphyrinogen-III synthase [Pseudomonadota bacterium]